MSERELIERARRGDPAAEREIYDAHVDRVFRLAYRMCGRGDLAEDFAQQPWATGEWPAVTDLTAGDVHDAAQQTQHELTTEALPGRVAFRGLACAGF